MGFRRFLFILMSGFNLLLIFASGATLLPDGEVEALREIARKLGKTDWKFTAGADPCTWSTPNAPKEFISAITCDCNATACHIVSIVLKSQNLSGVLPPELVKLPRLQEIDFPRNYLSGTIPREWGSMKLVNITLQANRLSGSIPKEFGNMTTLKKLSLEYNQFSKLPPELGDLINLEQMMISSNNFNGTLPETFGRLTNLTDFRISDNNFTGNIPNFIQNWKNLERLEMQASGLEGPIPPGISLLEKLTNLRISDINGTNVTFPSWNRNTNMRTLILRNCNISGEIPDYIGYWTKIKTLDLSFNKLTREIPRTFESLTKVDFMYLTGNLLTGHVPDWLKKGDDIDLSYNNFSSGINSCKQSNLNLFGTSSLGQNMTGVVPCLQSNECPKLRGYFYINCGATDPYTTGDITYEADSEDGTPSKFYKTDYWAFSSTGHFLDNDDDRDYYLADNASQLLMKDYQLYTRARKSPLSLTYYGFCLGNGNYNVTLHFAEIMFTDGKTYNSLGRRIFDVYIQGELVLKDYNIEDDAGGVGKEKKRNFSVVVTSGTLEIRFYWAGKGTTAIPKKGVYGPLISAISVNSDYKPPPSPSKISVGAVVGIVVSGVALVFMVVGLLWWKGCLGGERTREQDLRGLDLQTGSFTLRQIKAATNNFDVANKIGEGGFGSVYKGLLYDGTIIAVKQLSSKSKQGNREFVNEIGMISALQHPHLVKLYGCCIEGNQLLLVYEYMENNSLARALFGPKEHQMNLDWPTRHKICVGIARGLAYLHEESRLKIVHRDIKATNILLDKDLNAKISDFGLAKLDEEENTHISTRIAGTFGYMAPEYAMRGYLTDKADVYSFGIVALEIVSGRSNANYKPKEDGVYLLDWALLLKEKGNLMDLVDPKLESECIEEEVMGMINIALQCANASSILRPTMSTVVSMLEGRTFVQEPVSDPNISEDNLKFKAIRDQYPVSLDQSIGESQTQVMLADGPWTGSSTSVPDLYPISLNTQYWNNRE